VATTPKFGLDFVGDVPWGTHLCLFYETKDDLRDILVPYFVEGLQANEACMWVTTEPLGVEEATAALAKVVPNLDTLIQTEQMLILPYEEWYLNGGTFDANRVLEGWIEKEQEAVSRGFDGLRLTGNTFWVEQSLWDSFTAYEEAVNSVIGEHRMIAVCTYALGKYTASDIIDVIQTHVGALVRQGKKWAVLGDVIRGKEAEGKLLEAAKTVHTLNEKLREANEELWIANEELELRVNERSTELSITNEELKAANEELSKANLELRQEAQDRKDAEQAARASSFYARNLIEASLDPLVTINPEGKITDVNHATEEVTGCGRDELIGSEFSTYFTEPEKARAAYQQVFIYGFVKDYPLGMKSKSGTATDVLYNATVYRNEKGEIEGVFAAARDITERKRAEEELQRYSGHLEAIVEERTAQLKDAERLAGIGETAAMIGHDLRNPLQGLQYVVDLQKMRFERTAPEERDARDWDKAAESFERIGQQIFYMDKIVGDLQDYARPLHPEPERMSLGNLIEDVLAQVPHDKNVWVTTSVDGVHLEADRHLMHRVFSNLFLNAAQAMPEGGTLTVTGSPSDHEVVIKVKDTGVGIPAEMEEKLFSPLMTGKAKGTGLGLAVVKRIIDAHGGTITFESEKGKGTTFTVTLPASAVR